MPSIFYLHRNGIRVYDEHGERELAQHAEEQALAFFRFSERERKRQRASRISQAIWIGGFFLAPILLWLIAVLHEVSRP